MATVRPDYVPRGGRPGILPARAGQLHPGQGVRRPHPCLAPGPQRLFGEFPSPGGLRELRAIDGGHLSRESRQGLVHTHLSRPQEYRRGQPMDGRADCQGPELPWALLHHSRGRSRVGAPGGQAPEAPRPEVLPHAGPPGGSHLGSRDSRLPARDRTSGWQTKRAGPSPCTWSRLGPPPIRATSTGSGITARTIPTCS